ncbi:MAG: WD40 repeat domain-containing protein, partial [Gemmataceae bacterium]
RLAANAHVLLGLAGTVAGAKLIPAERHVPPEEQQWYEPPPVVPTVDAHGNPLPEGAVARLGTVQLRHGGTVTAVAFAPDGKSFASVGHDRYLRCWDAVSGKELWRQREAGAPTSLSYSPDGKSLIVGNWGGRMKRTGSSLHARNAADGKSRYLIEKRGGAVSFAADGKHFLSWTSASNLYLWETQTGKAVKTIADNNAAIPFQDEAGDSAVAVLFPDGKTIASFGYGAALQLWDVATGKSIRTLKERPDGIASYALTVSPDGKLLASATNKAPVGLFELPGGKELARFDAEDVYDLFFTPDSKTLAIATLDDEAALWDVATRKKTRTLTGAGPVASLSQDGKSLVCASGLGSWLSVIDWSTGKEKLGTPLSGHSYGLGGVAFTPDARKVFTRSYNSILCWDAGSGKLMERWPSSCGSNAFAGYAGLISSPRGMEIMDGHVGPGEDERVLALSADGTLLASFGGKKGSPEITLWNTATGKPARQLTCEGVRGLAFTPDGKSLAASCDQKADGSICIFDTSTGKLKFELTEKELLSLKPIALSPDGKLAAGGCIGGKVAVWNLLTQGRVHLLDAGEAEVQALAFSNGLLAAGTEKNGVVVWHCDTGKVHVTLEAPGEVHCLAVAPRGNVLAAGGTDGVVRLWDLGTGKLRKELRGHANEITGLAFSADGQKIASTSEDGTALIWELERR